MSEALRELARREKARRDLLYFCQYTFAGYQRTEHLRLLADKLEAVERGEVKRLMVFMPPRHGKSEMVSVRFPAWYLGRNPERRVILTSYAGDLAYSFSRRIRNVLRDDRFDTVFGGRSALKTPVALSNDSQAIQEWNLSAPYRGGLRAAGVGGGITGMGADLFLIDDPFKDRPSAESAAQRNAVWAWFTSTAYTRLEDDAAMVVIQTRWHEDDLAGRLLSQMMQGGERWEILSLPALAEEWAVDIDPEQAQQALAQGWWMNADPLGRKPGDALWPEKYDAETLAQIRGVIGGYEWDALYQQRPRRLEGYLIKANCIKIIEAAQVPADVRPVRYWDLAVGRSGRAHELAGALCGRDSQKNFYIMDVRCFSPPWSEARPKMVKVMLDDPIEVVQGIEVAGQQDGYYQEFRDDEQLQQRSIVPVAVRGDKEARAQLWATRIEDDRVFMVKGPWNDACIAECAVFPRGRADNRVDAISGAYQMLPDFVSWGDIPQAPTVASRWNLFNEVVAWRQ